MIRYEYKNENEKNDYIYFGKILQEQDAIFEGGVYQKIQENSQAVIRKRKTELENNLRNSKVSGKLNVYKFYFKNNKYNINIEKNKTGTPSSPSLN